MGMTGHYRHISARALEALVRDPSLAEPLVMYTPPDDDGVPPELRAMLAKLPKGAEKFMADVRQNFAALEPLRARARSALAPAGIGPDDIGEPLGIDKTWHGLHVLLAGTPQEPTPPPGNVVLGGTAIGKSLGYGPVRYLSLDEVREAAAALNALSDDDFRARCQPKALAQTEAYAMRPDDPEERAWLLDAFVRVRAYFAKASALGHAMLLYLS